MGRANGGLLSRTQLRAVTAVRPSPLIASWSWAGADPTSPRQDPGRPDDGGPSAARRTRCGPPSVLGMISAVPDRNGTQIPVGRDIGLPTLLLVRYLPSPRRLCSIVNRGAPMTATAVLPRPVAVPVPSRPAAAPGARAVACQRVLHTLVRRELRMLAELSTWAPAGEAARTA